jgi:hypothetical protein
MRHETHTSGERKMTETRMEKRSPATTVGSWKTGSAFGGQRIPARWNVVRSGKVVAVISKQAGAWVATDENGRLLTGFAKTRREACDKVVAREDI